VEVLEEWLQYWSSLKLKCGVSQTDYGNRKKGESHKLSDLQANIRLGVISTYQTKSLYTPVNGLAVMGMTTAVTTVRKSMLYGRNEAAFEAAK
jgi:hypothetical protein